MRMQYTSQEEFLRDMTRLWKHAKRTEVPAGMFVDGVIAYIHDTAKARDKHQDQLRRWYEGAKTKSRCANCSNPIDYSVSRVLCKVCLEKRRYRQIEYLRRKASEQVPESA